MAKLAKNEDTLIQEEPAFSPQQSLFLREKERCHDIPVVEVQCCPWRPTANICVVTTELRKMKPGKNPNRQLETLRPAALHRRGGRALLSSS